MRHAADELVQTVPAASFGGIALRGAVQTGLSQGVQVACQLLSVIALSRLLEPEDFGIIAMSAPVLALINVLKDFGLLQAIVQKKDLTYGQLNALFWINGAITLVVALLLVGIAPFVAAFYGDPRVGPVLMAMALPVLATGLSAQQTALLNRQMNFSVLSVITALQALTSLGVAFTWALIAPTYWALFGGFFLGTLVNMAIAWSTCGWVPQRPAPAAGVGGMLGFGANVTGFNLSAFVSRNLDNILIGRVWGSADLGLYDRAYKLLLFPLEQVANPLGRVMIPVLSRVRDEPERYSRAFFRVLNLMQFALLPGIAAAVAMADTAIPFLLGDRFADAAPIFAALGFAGLVQVSINPTGWLFISQGRSREFMQWGVVSAFITAAAIGIGVTLSTFHVAAFVSAASLVKMVPLWWLIARRGPITPDAVLRLGLPMALAGFLCVPVVHVAVPYLPGPAPWTLVGGTLLSYAAYAGFACLFPVGRAALGDMRLILSGHFRAIPPGPAPGENA